MASEAVKFIERHEGNRTVLYLDHLGIVTVGKGHALGHRPVPDAMRGLFPVATANGVQEAVYPGVLDRPWPQPVLDQLFAHDFTEAERAVRHLALLRNVNWDVLPEPKRIALVSMSFQLGVEGLGRFVHMWAAIAAGQWAEAEREALDSVWARETPARARETAAMLGGA